ncbi:sulfite exporter TauE/SafE family protein [Ornithinibacillus salinisoli]|uniref:Probable membrane transporter protein n=1 Tax=Ornithinibacillus salinisoli TaxID=1848459 RepID=A0ABW4W1T2_9BACI
MDISFVLILLILGITAGCYGTIIGAGGGFIFVPALLLILNMEPAVAAGSGLVIVLINSISGVFGYVKQKKIQFRVGIAIGVGAIPGSLIGVWLLQLYSSQSFYIVFASVLLVLGVFLLTKSLPSSKQKIGENKVSLFKESNRKFKWLLILGFFMGILSSYLGIGGGWILVPILIYLFHVPTHNATATSIFALCIYSSVGVASQLFYSNIDWLTVIWGGFGVIIGSQVGVKLAQKIPSKVIVQMLSFVLIIIGVRMYFQ